jgi:branched-chain amino acid transport system substrate-binding protein
MRRQALGKPIKIVSADQQNKPDVGAAITSRRWDIENVDALFDMPVSSVALSKGAVGRRDFWFCGGATAPKSLFEVKSPAQYEENHDYYNLVREIAPQDETRSRDKGHRPLVK